MRRYRLLCILILGLISHIALGQNAPVDTGSEEVLKESAMQDSDDTTGKTFMVYESVKNKGLAKEGKFSEMTFYIAPLFRLIPDTETKVAYGRTVLEEDGIVQYTFWVECFAKRIKRQAIETINQHYDEQVKEHQKKQKTKGKYVFSEEKVKHMQHGMVVIKPANLPASLMKVIKPARIPSTESPTTVLLDEFEDFTIYVPKERDSTFETLLKDRGIRFDFTVYFNVMNLSRLQMSWSAEHVSDSKTYKALTSGGDYYVTAGQVNQIIREAAANKGAFVYLDPDIDDKIWEKSLEIFQKMTGDLQSLTVRNQAQAEQLEEKLRQGMGLSAKDFQPITLMWNVAEEIQTIEDYEEANEVIRDTYQRNKRAFQEAKKEGRDVSIQVSGSARFSFAKAATSLGVKMHSDHRTNVDELDEKVEKGYLSNNDDLKKYKSKLRKLKGQEIKIVGRGIDLIESSQLKQKLNIMASYVFVQPMREAKTFTTSSKISSSAKKGRGDILEEQIAEIAAAGGGVGDIRLSVLNEIPFQQIHGKDWVLMDGRLLSKKSPLYRLTKWAKLPDARGRFFRMKDYGTGMDASGDKPVGTLLDYQTGRPKVNFTTNTTGSHNHSMGQSGNHNHGMSNAGQHQHGHGLLQGDNAVDWGDRRRWYDFGNTQPAGNHTHAIHHAGAHTHTIHNAGAHSHVINGGGDKETRPKNIIINAFIKIR